MTKLALFQACREGLAHENENHGRKYRNHWPESVARTPSYRFSKETVTKLRWRASEVVHSAGKCPCLQSWQPEFNPRDPYGRRREVTPVSYSLTPHIHAVPPFWTNKQTNSIKNKITNFSSLCTNFFSHKLGMAIFIWQLLWWLRAY